MGKVSLWMQASLDGFAEGPHQQTDWPLIDEDLHGRFLKDLSDATAFLYGRRTYEAAARFWPTADNEPAISPFYVRFAQLWKQVPKVVFSKSIDKALWNTTVAKNVVEEVMAMKDRPGANLALFGGPSIASTFRDHDLIDDYRFFVHPILRGSGTPLFPRFSYPADLELVDNETVDSGIIHLHYRRTRTDRTPLPQL